MSYQDFLTTLTTGLSTRIDSDLTFEIRSFPRNNDTHYDGLVIMKPDRNVSPTIYLTPYYHRYLDGVPLAEIYDDIIHTYTKHMPDEDFDTSLFTDYKKASPHIVMRLVSYQRNRGMLKDVPHFKFQDLAVLYYCMVYSDGRSQANILIHNDHLKLWEIDEDELYRVARENTPRLLPLQITAMSQLIEDNDAFGCEELQDFNIPMYVVSNTFHTNGATSILYEGLLDRLSETFESDLVLLPSSIHEILIVPVAGLEEFELEHYKTMVQEVNETQLTDADVLSDHAYIYSRVNKSLSF